MKIIGICLALVLQTFFASASPSALQKESDFVESTEIMSGALLADSFDGPYLDQTVWQRPNWVQHDPFLAVGTEYGRLLISGISNPLGKQHQYVGILSKNYRETDVAFAARLRVQSSFEKEGRIQHHIHLCTGDWPDFFTEIVFGRIETGSPRWYAGYMGKVREYSGYSEYLEPTIPATGTEGLDWREVLIVHDGVTGATQNYLIDGDRWVAVGPPQTLPFNHSHVELKVNVTVPGVKVHMEVDDARLYPNPARYPATIVVNSNKLDGPIQNLKIRVFDAATKQFLGEAVTDEDGQSRVLLKSTVVYPVAARIEVWDGQRQILNSDIPRVGVRGLYPGDVRAIKLPPKNRKSS